MWNIMHVNFLYTRLGQEMPGRNIDQQENLLLQIYKTTSMKRMGRRGTNLNVFGNE
jgi:hypothetical protein